MSQALQTVEHEANYLAVIRDVWFNPGIAPSDKREVVLATLLTEADTQVDAATHADCPWFLTGTENEAELQQKSGRRRYQVLSKATEILDNLRTALNIGEVDLLVQIAREGIYLFPEEGDYPDLFGMICPIYATDKPSSRVTAILRFTEFADEFEAAGVTAKDVALIIEEHSRGGKVGASILGSMATAASKLLRDTDILTAAERKQGLQQIASDALVMGVNEFEQHYSSGKVRSLRYDEQTDDLGGTLFVFHARNAEEANLLRSRMRDAIQRDEGLFRPVTASQIVKAVETGEWMDLVRSAVLADRHCRAVYGMLQAADRPCDVDHFLRYTRLTPQEVNDALSTLVHWGLATRASDGDREVWSI